MIELQSQLIFILHILFLPKKLVKSLINAKKRKVKITMILPGIPDKKIIYFFTRQCAFFLKDDLFHVYFYQEGFIHGKLLLIDKKIVSIGNVNLDYYSLLYNFEYNVLLDEENTIKNILEDIEKVKNHSQK